MKEVFFMTGSYYLIGKVRKDYKIGDTLKLKNEMQINNYRY